MRSFGTTGFCNCYRSSDRSKVTYTKGITRCSQQTALREINMRIGRRTRVHKEQSGLSTRGFGSLCIQFPTVLPCKYMIGLSIDQGAEIT